MTSRRIVLIGEIIVDVTLPTVTASTKVRMGGVCHAARAAWASGTEYALCYYCPAYLDAEVEHFLAAHGSSRAIKIGNISGCPNVMLIGEATEAGSQNYEHLLSDHLVFSGDETSLLNVVTDEDDVLIVAGNYSLSPLLKILAATKARVHLDIGNGPQKLEYIASLCRPVSTLFLSTSAGIFSALASSLPSSLIELLGKLADNVVLKENRGGSRLFSSSGTMQVGSQRRQIVHSVGVGDTFDVVYVAFEQKVGALAALNYASWIAAEYAATTFPDDFKRETGRILKIGPTEISQIPGVSLSWEMRATCQIYIAAPDFDYVDRRPIETLVECLRYHNFSPRLPVRENGQATEKMTYEEKRPLYNADMALIDQCGLMIAVNLHDDPGTLIEIGLAAAKGIPVLVFDPFNKAQNVMLLHVPELVSGSLDQIITATFDIIARSLLCH